MGNLFFQSVQCPYCGEAIELAVDDSAGAQAYIEDCSVCCRPIEVCQAGVGADAYLEVRREDD
jgi:hypothetical protein